MKHAVILLPFVALSLVLATESVGAQVFQGEPHVYKKVDNRELSLYVLKPADWKSGDTRPAVVHYHGGGWVGGAPTQFDEQSKYLITRGMVCIQVQYRLLAKESKSEPPDMCIHDAKSSMRWVRSHAKELGIDPDRIAASGGSAGGHLAAFLGMAQGVDDPHDDKSISAKPNALLLFNPVFDNGPEDGWGVGRVGDRYKELSPAHNISADDPPTIIFLGKKDNLIPVSVVERFAGNMKQAGVRCEVRLYDEQPHGFFNNDPYRTMTVIEADKFLASLGWLNGEPTIKPPPMPPVDAEAKPAKKEKKEKKSAPSNEQACSIW